jgi:hypothetical protein
MGNIWRGLVLFLDDPAVPLHNNASERARRGPDIGRVVSDLRTPPMSSEGARFGPANRVEAPEIEPERGRSASTISRRGV